VQDDALFLLRDNDHAFRLVSLGGVTVFQLLYIGFGILFAVKAFFGLVNNAVLRIAEGALAAVYAFAAGCAQYQQN